MSADVFMPGFFFHFGKVTEPTRCNLSYSDYTCPLSCNSCFSVLSTSEGPISAPPPFFFSFFFFFLLKHIIAFEDRSIGLHWWRWDGTANQARAYANSIYSTGFSKFLFLPLFIVRVNRFTAKSVVVFYLLRLIIYQVSCLGSCHENHS